jgi:hypothetical protein
MRITAKGAKAADVTSLADLGSAVAVSTIRCGSRSEALK